MSNLVEYADWFLQLDGAKPYLAVGLLLLGGSLGLPIPEDLPLILAGVMISRGNSSTQIMFPVCYCAILLGDMIVFSIGYFFGPKILNHPLLKKRLSASRIDLITSGLQRHALFMIFLARHLFYLRTATFLTCGAFRISLLKFITSDALAALVSVPIMIGLGYLMGQHLESLWVWISRFRTASLAIGAILLILLIFLLCRRHKKRELN